MRVITYDVAHPLDSLVRVSWRVEQNNNMHPPGSTKEHTDSARNCVSVRAWLLRAGAAIKVCAQLTSNTLTIGEPKELTPRPTPNLRQFVRYAGRRAHNAFKHGKCVHYRKCVACDSQSCVAHHAWPESKRSKQYVVNPVPNTIAPDPFIGLCFLLLPKWMWQTRLPVNWAWILTKSVCYYGDPCALTIVSYQITSHMKYII